MKGSTKLRMPPKMPHHRVIECSLLFVVLNFKPQPRGLVPGFDHPIDEEQFFFVCIDRSPASDALHELTHGSSHFGQRLLTVRPSFSAENVVITTEPLMLSGDSIAYAREAEHWEIRLADDDADEVFWKPMGPYAEAYLKHLREVSRLLDEGEE